MNIELILWIVAFIVIWETFYIIGLKREWHSKSWIENKVLSVCYAALFIVSQLVILSSSLSGTSFGNLFPLHYERLIWEVIIIVAVVIFFYINKQIAKSIENNRGKK